MANLQFSKMHGLGNDFIVLNGVDQQISLSNDQVRFLADRHFGIGCDQLLLVEAYQGAEADFRYRIFNADGGEVEQCGNGARCFGRYIAEKKLSGKRLLNVSTSNGLIKIRVLDRQRVAVDMGAPILAPADIPFEASEQQIIYSLEHQAGRDDINAVSMGNPHAVLVVDSVAKADVDRLGPIIERHARFHAPGYG